MTHTHTSSPGGMFAVRQKVRHPEVIMPEGRRDNVISYVPTRLSGNYFRVAPKSPREIFALQMLEHHREKFAPAHGDGVIVTEDALRKFSY